MTSTLNRRLLYSTCALAAGSLALFLGAARPTAAADEPSVVHSPVAPAAPVALAAATEKSSKREALLALAASDPLALAKLAVERYQRNVRDYRCVFLKQERIKGELKPQEEIKVLYRDEPQSVFMQWQRNADDVKRALFIDRKDFVNDDGEPVAKVEPAGVILRAFVSELTMPIHGDRARAASRRTIDEFGFLSTLRILEKVNNLADRNDELSYKFEGEGSVDGRRTLVFVRTLPAKARQGAYPDAKMVLHLDEEWLLPTAVYSYEDAAGKRLLGSYILTKVELNPGLTDADFKF